LKHRNSRILQALTVDLEKVMQKATKKKKKMRSNYLKSNGNQKKVMRATLKVVDKRKIARIIARSETGEVEITQDNKGIMRI